MVAFIYYLLYRLKHILALPSDIDKQVAIFLAISDLVFLTILFSHIYFLSHFLISPIRILLPNDSMNLY